VSSRGPRARAEPGRPNGPRLPYDGGVSGRSPHSLETEYRAAREGRAHRWRPAAVLDVGGADRESFLQGQLTQDVRGLAPGEVRPAAALTPKGKLLFWGRLVGLPDRMRLVLPEEVREAAYAHLVKYAAFQKASVDDLSEELRRLALYGPAAGDAAPPPDAIALPGEAEVGSEWLVPSGSGDAAERALREAGSVPLSDETAEALRIEAGRPRFGKDADGSNLPDEVGLDSAISSTKGCYVGQEIVARRKVYGRVNWRLVGFRFPEGPLGAGTPIHRERSGTPPDRSAGRVTSSAVSPRLGPIGLGFVFHDVGIGDRLFAKEPPAASAIVCELPFA